MIRPKTTRGSPVQDGADGIAFKFLAVLPENKQSKEGNEDSVLEVRIAVRSDPLQKKTGENAGIKPGEQEAEAPLPANGASDDKRRPLGRRGAELSVLSYP